MAELSTGLLGFAITLMLHASVLLGTVWLLERVGALRNPGWAELAWRGALFGALFSAGLATGLSAWRGVDRVAASPPSVSECCAPQAQVDAPVGASDAATRRASTFPASPVPRALPPSPSNSGTASTSTSSPALAATRLNLPYDVVTAIAALWLALTLAWWLLTARRTASVFRLLRRARLAVPATPAQREQAAAIAQQLALRVPHLHLDASLSSPVALPRLTVLLPRWSTQLPVAESRALLAHEIAHLARRDPFWRIAQHVALAPLCLHPLAWIAVHRLEALAERQADTVAARLLGDGRPLAECLAHCLARSASLSPAAPRFALAMAERPGAVVDRVKRLLEEDPMEYQPPSPRRTRVVIALGLVAALALPGIAVTALADGLRQGHSVSINSDNGHETVSIKTRRGDYALDVEMEGKIEFSPDESDVIGMAADAEFTLEETRDAITRSIEFAPAAAGVTRDYRVDGKAHAFDADARAWLALALPEIFRSTGIDAENRSKRILARGGPDALLAEVALIESDYGRARYLGLAFTLATLDAAQLSKALELTRAIDSDYELRQVLSAALTSHQLAPAQQLQVLDLAQALDSDYERAELLVDAVARFTLRDEAFAHWSKALEGIDSDYEKRRVLEALLVRDEDNAAAVRLAFAAADDIGSDYEKRQLIEAGVARAHGDVTLRQEYLRVATGIGSDYERKESLQTLLRSGPVDVALATAVLDTIDGIGSDYERKEALQALAAVMPTDAGLIERYRASARRLGDHERGQAEKALDRLAVVN